jgi:hypothetical protein
LHPGTVHRYFLVLLVSDEEDSLSWSEVSEPGVCGIAGCAGRSKGVLKGDMELVEDGVIMPGFELEAKDESVELA